MADNLDRSRLNDAKLGRLLVLLNPGSFTRHYMVDMATAATRLGIPNGTLELHEIWAANEAGRAPDPRVFADAFKSHNIRAVLSCGPNGLIEWPAFVGPDGRPMPFFEQLGIPHIMWWTDHPQWARERFALRPDLQPIFRSPNNHYLVKSELAAREVHDRLGWPNCHALPVAENPDRLKPVTGIAPDFDVVAIAGSPPSLDPNLAPLINEDDPDVHEILRRVNASLQSRLLDLWKRTAPDSLRPHLGQLGREWANARSEYQKTGSFYLFQSLEPLHPKAATWLRRHPEVYFDALHQLWDYGRWQRTFYLAYLARFFKVGVFGTDWSSLGLGKSDRIDHDAQPNTYARGRIAISISQCGDEEGITHKPFQIAASGVAMVHIDSKGLTDCFTPGLEVESFNTPRQAREVIASLLADPSRRSDMAEAARARLCRDHTWEKRLPQMLHCAGVHIPSIAPRRSLTAAAVLPSTAQATPAARARTTDA